MNTTSTMEEKHLPSLSPHNASEVSPDIVL